MSMRTRPLRISVSPLPIKEEDLRAFAQHLSYRESPRRPLRIYEFPAKQHEEDAAMNMQIVLRPGIELEMNRARAQTPSFARRGNSNVVGHKKGEDEADK
ncbi:hypothetical protein AAVH_18532 [Aphelenchoides avenae]|nr:hypothetical protein AAVH_18532 [Aphelenchus avenae]